MEQDPPGDARARVDPVPPAGGCAEDRPPPAGPADAIPPEPPAEDLADYELLDDDPAHPAPEPPIEGVIPLRRAARVEEVIREFVPVASARLNGAQVLRAWIRLQPRELSQEERDEQSGPAKWLATNHPPGAIAAAFLGIGQIAPHCDPFHEPWDLKQLKSKFSRAAAAAANHPEFRKLREAAEFEEAFAQARSTGGPFR